MLGHRQMDAGEFLSIGKRRIWWIVVPVIVAPIVAYGISLKLPNRFTSTALIIVEEQKVPDNFVRPVITGDLVERLSTMEEQIFSRTRLQPIIDRFGLYADEPKLAVEDKIEKMRKAVEVSPARSGFVSSGVPGFEISFSDSDPRRAQHVCAEITSMFMQENLHAREQRAEGTTDFLKSQLDEAKRKLDDQDAKFASFKLKYIGQLPGQEQGNFNMLAALRSQLDANTQAINRLQQDRTYAESNMNQQLETWKAQQSTGATGSPDTLEQQLASEQSQLSQLQLRYTDTHPDVMKLKSHIAKLQKQIDASGSAKPADVTAAATTPAAHVTEPQSVQQIRAQLHAIDVNVGERTRETDQLRQQIKIYESKLQLSPSVEEEYKLLTRDYDNALGFYNELLTKKNQSQLATDLERRQQGEQFRMIDPPNLPEKPTFPNRPVIAAGGLMFGLAIGVGIALLLEFKDHAIRNEKDIQHFLEVSTLAQVPSFAPNGKFRSRKRKPKSKSLEEAHNVPVKV